MDLPRLKAMKDYHKINPPLHVVVAAYLGVSGNTTEQSANSENDLAELMAAFPQTES